MTLQCRGCCSDSKMSPYSILAITLLYQCFRGVVTKTSLSIVIIPYSLLIRHVLSYWFSQPAPHPKRKQGQAPRFTATSSTLMNLKAFFANSYTIVLRKPLNNDLGRFRPNETQARPGTRQMPRVRAGQGEGVGLSALEKRSADKDVVLFRCGAYTLRLSGQ
jgi:hypothetical protein